MNSLGPDVPYVDLIHWMRDVVIAPEQTEQCVALEITGKDAKQLSETHHTIQYHNTQEGIILQDKEVGSHWDTSYIYSMNTSYLQVVHSSHRLRP